MKFDQLEIQKNIEEKRLILGKKLEEFLLKILLRVIHFFSQIFSSKFCALCGCLFIIAISILAQSSRDIGHDSAALLEITKKFLNGGKYHQDFFENNLPLFLYLNTLPHFLAKIFDLNLIICSQIISNLVGILTLYFSAKILAKSEIYKDRTIFNLIILSFACGFFWRVFTLQFNEFGTKSTYLLAFAFPYISYHLVAENNLKKFDQAAIGILAALLFCLKPNYGILVVVFEVAKLFKKKSIISGFCLRNYITLFTLISYLVLIKTRVSDYLEAWQLFASLYYSEGNFLLMLILKSDIFAVFLLTFLCRSLIKKYEFLQPFFLASLSISLIIISEFIAGFDQRFAFYSICLPLVFLLTFLLIKNHFINWKRDWFFLASILIIFQFDGRNSFSLLINLCAFWWVFVLFKNKKWQEFLQEKKLAKLSAKLSFLKEIFVPRNFISWLFFLSVFFAILVLSFFKETVNLAWIFSAVIFVLLLFFNQKISADKKFLTLNAVSVFAVLSYFLNLHLTAIFNFFDSEASIYKSPNYLNEQLIKNIKNYSNKEGEVTIISNTIPMTGYPVINYLKKENPLPFVNLGYLYSEIEKTGENLKLVSDEKKYLFYRLKQQIISKKNHLIFVEKNDLGTGKECSIGFLEYYFRDEEFRKSFAKNYVFLNQIVEVKNDNKKAEFFDKKNILQSTELAKIITNKIEIYSKKSD